MADDSSQGKVSGNFDLLGGIGEGIGSVANVVPHMLGGIDKLWMGDYDSVSGAGNWGSDILNGAGQLAGKAGNVVLRATNTDEAYGTMVDTVNAVQHPENLFNQLIGGDDNKSFLGNILNLVEEFVEEVIHKDINSDGKVGFDVSGMLSQVSGGDSVDINGAPNVAPTGNGQGTGGRSA